MDRKWVDEQHAKYKAGFEPAYKTLMNFIENCPCFDDEKRRSLKAGIEDLLTGKARNIETYYSCMYSLKPGLFGMVSDDDEPAEIVGSKMYHDMNIEGIFERVSRGPDAPSYAEAYLDSKPHHFHGDIVITDPCYFGLEESYYELDNVLKDFIQRDTIYGDWSCHVFDMNTKQVLGRFCADSGQVCVADLDEVNEHNARWTEQYNPDFATFGYTVIRDFDGDAWFEVREEDYIDYKGNPAVDYVVVACGKGRNFKTGEEIVFEGKQTGL